MSTETVIPLHEDGSFAAEIALQPGDRVERIVELRESIDGVEYEKTVALLITSPDAP